MLGPDDPRHGAETGYDWHKCRCEACTGARFTSNDKRRRANKEWMDRAKDKPCADCGGRFPTVCMDFDHRDPALKSFRISEGGLRSRVSLEAEIAKCDVVCANCHRVRTADQMSRGVLKVGRPRKQSSVV